MPDQSSDLYPQMGGSRDNVPETPDTSEEEDGAETTLIPKSMLAGKEWKPGDEIIFEIVRIHDDSAEIKYAPEKPKESESEQEPESADSEIDRMSMEGSSKGY